ncbi:MAG: VOC family protein [Anaerolineae bacterium]
MSRVVHFEIPAKDPEKVVAFYTTVFGWEIKKWDGPQDYWLVTTGKEGEPGIDGAIYSPNEMMSQVVNTIGVASVDDFMAKVKAGGGRTLTEKMSVPGVGYLAYCADPEGNMFGIFQDNPGAGQ